MAIKYQVLKDKLKTDQLTPQELEWIRNAEEFIDRELISKFGENGYHQVSIDRTIVTFHYSPIDKKPLDTNSPRRSVMTKFLVKRYSDAGWDLNWEEELECNYVIFKGK